jgi:hypothetical protein
MKQYVNLTDMDGITSLAECTPANRYGGTGHDASGGTPPVGARGNSTCLVLEISDPENRVNEVTIALEDPPYEPPWFPGEAQTSAPNNPRVYNDFGIRREGDNRGTGAQLTAVDRNGNTGSGQIVNGRVVLESCMQGESCQSRKVAKALLTTSTYGGDNYRFRVTFTPEGTCSDPNPTPQVQAFPADSDTQMPRLTVWRKTWVYKDVTKGCEDLPFKSGGVCDQNLSLVKGAFDDGFYEMTLKAAGTTDAPNWVTALPDQECTQAATNDPTQGAGRGIVGYEHDQWMQDMPHTPHGVNSLGTRLIADDYAIDAVDPQEGVKEYHTPNEGATCVDRDPESDHHARHSAISVWFVGHPSRNNIRWLSPRFFGAPTLHDWCGNPDDEAIPAPHAVPLANCLGYEYNPQRRDILISRMALHEIGHSVLREPDHIGTQCGGVTQSWDWEASIMRYSCVFDDRFGGWFSASQVSLFRAGQARQ